MMLSNRSAHPSLHGDSVAIEIDDDFEDVALDDIDGSSEVYEAAVGGRNVAGADNGQSLVLKISAEKTDGSGSQQNEKSKTSVSELKSKDSSASIKKKKSKKTKKKKVKKQKKVKLSKKDKVKKCFRPETKDQILRKNPQLLEANWPIVDFLIVAQIVFAFIFLFNALLHAVLGLDGAWKCVLFSIILFITAFPSVVFIAKGNVEAAIVIYSLLQLICSFFGYWMIIMVYTNEEEVHDSSLFTLWFIIIWQLVTTLFINWRPYRELEIKKLRKKFSNKTTSTVAVKSGSTVMKSTSCGTIVSSKESSVLSVSK